MKIAIVQFSPVLGNPDATLEKLEQLFSRIANCNLIVLPELANSGYNFLNRQQAIATSENLSRSRFVDLLVAMAFKTNGTIVSGINELDNYKLYNTSILVSSKGIIGKYRKLHLFMDEKDYFEPGNMGLPVFTVGNIRLGMLICFDYLFPEAWRTIALKGADIIAHPSNLVTPYGQKVVPIHALVNHVFTITANRTGTENGLTFRGGSLAVGPTGEIIARGSTGREQIIVFDIDPLQARDKMITPRNHVLEDRRPDCYI